MINYTPTPDFYNDYIQHFNPFHDPRNGQFTTGRGGGSIYSSLPRKVAAKYVTADNQDMFNDILYRNKYGKDKVEKKQAMKDFKKAVRELSNDFRVPNNIVKKYAKRGFEDRERYIEDSKKQQDFKSPEKLSDYMKTFKYSEFSGLKSPKEVGNTKTGSCHDQVMYELDELRKQGKNPKATFWIEVDPKTGQGGMTHSYVYYKDGKDIKYFENAWGNHEGIKTFKSSNEIMDYFKDQHNSGNVGDSKKYSEMIFCNFNDKNHKIGESLQDLVNICLDDEIIYKKK